MIMNKFCLTLLLVCGFSCAEARTTLRLVDSNATRETKALYSNLWKIQKRGFMFGHHDDLAYGRYWRGTEGKSDTKDVCGDYPAIYSMDFASMMDDRYNPNSEWAAATRKNILAARRRGEVITACAHLNNPLTGGDSWDNSSKEVVTNILKNGSPTQAKFNIWLDRLIDYVKDLKDDSGVPIPIIFRPFHEHTQTWNWWGRGCTTETEFVALWRYTVNYLIEGGIHQFIYVISPQSHGADPEERFTFWWPGDDYVDMIGYDYYEGENPANFCTSLKNLSSVSQKKKKPCAVTETGLEAFTNPHFWTEQILKPASAKGVRVSFITFWRNKYVGKNEKDTHYFSVFPGHPSEQDFRDFYRNKRTFFSKDLPNMYSTK